MEVEFLTEPTGRRVVFRGPFDPEAMVAAIRTAPDDDSTGGSIIDLRAVEGLDFDPTGFAAVARAVRSRFPRPAEFRYAIVADGEHQRRVAEWMAVTRDVAAAVTEARPEIRAFTSLEEARSWIDGGAP